MIKKLFDNRYFILLLFPFLIGSLTVLSFQPFNLTIINFVIIPLFFYLITYISKKSQSVYRKKPYKINLFLFGLSFGFGFYLSGVSWIINSLTFDDNFKILIPFGIIFIPLFLGLFIAIQTLLITYWISMESMGLQHILDNRGYTNFKSYRIVCL